MLTKRTHPVTHALAVANACSDLALEAEALSSFPRPLATSLLASANDAAARLKIFLSTHGDSMCPLLAHRSSQAQSDLVAIAQFAELVLTYSATPRNAGYLVKIVRRTANHAVDCLNHVEEAIHL